jgi:type VI secretion system protein ImpM
MPRELSMQARGETGFYGKMPDQGDFVSRRLAHVFVQRWDEWLQQCLAHCRTALAADWEHLYRDAPVWRFLLAPGTCGAPAWAGLVQPSVDRVGRYFPLTVAAELPSDVEVLDTMIRASGWYEAIERIAALAFDNQITVDGMERQLSAVAFPAHAIVHADSAEDTLPIAAREVSALKVGCPNGSGLVNVRNALREDQVSVGHEHCVWFNANPGDMERVVLVTRGLPLSALSQALFDGRWAAHGWPAARSDAQLPV